VVALPSPLPRLLELALACVPAWVEWLWVWHQEFIDYLSLWRSWR